MSVVIVGNGPWSKKLQATIEVTKPGELLMVGAREFMREPTHGDIFWLATTPANQLRILPIIPNVSRVILEKPTFRDSRDLEAVYREFQRRNGFLHFSLPWNYSSCLDSIKNSISIHGKTCIQIHRGGPLRRSYIPPYLDWLPHDLGLISELPESDSIAFTEVKAKGDLMHVHALLGEIELFIQVGLFESRRAQWSIQAQDNQPISINFYENVAKTKERPLERMFKEFLIKPNHSERIFAIWRKYFRAEALR